MHSVLGGPKEEIIMCRESSEGEVKDSFTEGRPTELLIGYLPSEQVGKGYFGQREHSVQRNAVLAHIATHIMLFSRLWLLSSSSSSFPDHQHTFLRPGGNKDDSA